MSVWKLLPDRGEVWDFNMVECDIVYEVGLSALFGLWALQSVAFSEST